jgi:EpsI family protein
MSPLLTNKYVRALSLTLLAQAVLYYAVASRAEKVPVARPLGEFPVNVGGWQMIRQSQIEKDVLDVLKADDTLSRAYLNPGKTSAANLFIAFFKTQRSGQAPHSPKNCLPGAGWQPTATGLIDVPVPDAPGPITVNRYVVSLGDERRVVLYWYQSPRRAIASEYSAKVWLVADSIRYHRSDTALVRVEVPVYKGDENAATGAAVAFVQAVYPELRKQFPW